MSKEAIYQVSTLQALALGYTKAVATVKDLLSHGDTGLGTFEDVFGEMIVANGHCYQALSDGTVQEADPELGVPFAAVTELRGAVEFDLEGIDSIDKLKEELTLKVEEGFGLNSMHVARIDGEFSEIKARSELAFESQHIDLKSILNITQKDFAFENVKGSMVCVYYPDYMDGINAPGWHLHFVSDDHTKGGHVFELKMTSGAVKLDKISRIEIQLPKEPGFDTYSLKDASGSDIKKVEQGKG